MTNARTHLCPMCSEALPDEDALVRHAEQAHHMTRQQMQQQEADSEMVRQQDVVGRREQAGQPRGDERETPGNQGRNLHQANPAHSADDIRQQTQQQQPRTQGSTGSQGNG